MLSSHISSLPPGPRSFRCLAGTIRASTGADLAVPEPHPFDEWFRVLAAEQRLAAEQVRQLPRPKR
jgi:hypothetical protein